MEDKKEVYNDCYWCDEMFIDILDLINHIRSNHKENVDLLK